MERLPEFSQQLDPSQSTQEVESSRSSGSSKWLWFGHRIPRSEIEYFVISLILYIVIIVSLSNLTIGVEPSNLWIALLSSSLGVFVPQPRMINKST